MMAEIPWPEWPEVAILAKTNFGSYVKARDDTKRIIAATLERTPYAQSTGVSKRRMPPQILPEEIAARKVARIKRLLDKKWPLTRARISSARRVLETGKTERRRLACAERVSVAPSSSTEPVIVERPKNEPDAAENSAERAVRLRLAAFMAREKPTAGETQDESHNPRPLVDLESTEMNAKSSVALDSARITGELHTDKLASTLAEPLDGTMVYCHPDALEAHPNATAAYDHVGIIEKRQLHHFPNETDALITRQARRDADWQRILGKEALRKGNTSAAYKHFGRAASLYDAIRKEPRTARSARSSFVYTKEAHLAAIRVQRNFRRHLRDISHAITTFKAIFRGAMQRFRNESEDRRQNAAARFLQRPFRLWYKRRIAAVVRMQKQWRGRIGRRDALEKRHQLALAMLVISMGPILRQWLKRFQQRREQKSARFLQHVWRGCKIRAAHATKLADEHKAKIVASSIIQSKIRCQQAKKWLQTLRNEAFKDEATRAAAELYWIRSAQLITELRASLSLGKNELGGWPLNKVLINAWDRQRRRRQKKNDSLRYEFRHLDTAGFGSLGYHEVMSLLRSQGIVLREVDIAVRRLSCFFLILRRRLSSVSILKSLDVLLGTRCATG